MFGSFIGNVAGISYFLAFQILGILLALYLFQKEKTGTTLLFGSVFGSFALHWLPSASHEFCPQKRLSYQ